MEYLYSRRRKYEKEEEDEEDDVEAIVLQYLVFIALAVKVIHVTIKCTWLIVCKSESVRTHIQAFCYH